MKRIAGWVLAPGAIGVPVMRPIFLEYPQAVAFYGEDHEFLFGRDLLYLQIRLGTYEVSFAPGRWYDYWMGTAYEGGTSVSVKPALAEMPLYVRGGAILPEHPVVQHTGEKPNGPLGLRVYPGEDCRGSLYLDDGESFAYQRGEFLRVNYS